MNEPTPTTAQQAATIAATKTAVFEIRAPSAWKRAALLDAMKRTHLATHAVLAALLSQIDHVRGLTKKTERAGYMQQIAYATLRPRALGAACGAAARVDAIGMAESYLQTLVDGRDSAAFPRLSRLDGSQKIQYTACLDELAETHATIKREGDLRDDLSRLTRADHPRPLSLHGYAHFYRLLRHPASDRLFAYVNVLSGDSRFTPTQADANARARQASGEMSDIGTGEMVRCKRPTWLLLPLAFGFGYQEREFLLSGKPGGGRIVYRPERDAFELHASFNYVSPRVETGVHFLGVDRGIHSLAAWAVVDADGGLVEEDSISGLDLHFVRRTLEQRNRDRQRRGSRIPVTTRRAQSDEAVHRTANELVAAAKRLSARVVLESLTMQRRLRAVPKAGKGGQSGWAARRILSGPQYAKLVQVLTYKLARVGLPKPIEVSAAFTSQTCLECGWVDAKSRRIIKRLGEDTITAGRFHCVRCGHASDAHRNAARVIALKGAWLVQVPMKAARGSKELPEDKRFAQYVLDAARRRGSRVGQPIVPL